MAIPTNKQELIDDIKKNYHKLRLEFDIDTDLVNKKTMIGQIKNTKMSVHDLISYLLGWGELVLEWEEFYNKNDEIPDIDTNYSELAKTFYDKYKEIDYKRLIEKLDNNVENIVNMLEKYNDKELYQTIWYTTKVSKKDYTFGKLVQLNTSSPYKNARNRIKKWKKV